MTRRSKVNQLLSKVPEAIQRDGDGYRGRTGWLGGLLAEIVEAAREEGRREARLSKPARGGLRMIADHARWYGYREIAQKRECGSEAEEQRAVRMMDSAYGWVQKLDKS